MRACCQKFRRLPFTSVKTGAATSFIPMSERFLARAHYSEIFAANENASDRSSSRSERDAINRYRSHILQLCEMRLRNSRLDAMLRLCCTKNERKKLAAPYVPASRRKWRSRAWPGRQG